MKKIIRIIACVALFLPLALGIQSFNSPEPVPAPEGTVISLTNTGGLDGAGWWETVGTPPYTWLVWHWTNGRQVKVTFFGSRYSDSQDVTDPNSPDIATDFADPHTVGLAQYYYRDGYATIWSRESSVDSWISQGTMNMSSSNCTMDGSKVMVFTVNCAYLYNP
ncbi:MAG: hypothetical protein KAH17_05965 [Bacteroidales bacterium]|nr:hypothetical protein [Bacteroidales bacterium]